MCWYLLIVAPATTISQPNWLKNLAWVWKKLLPTKCAREMATSGFCRDVLVVSEGLEVRENFYLFGLGGVDLILGITWLAFLREVRTNWMSLTMSFGKGDGEVMIEGKLTSSTTKEDLSYKQNQGGYQSQDV